MSRRFDRWRWKVARRLAPPLKATVVGLTGSQGGQPGPHSAAVMVREGARWVNATPVTFLMDTPGMVAGVTVAGGLIDLEDLTGEPFTFTESETETP